MTLIRPQVSAIGIESEALLVVLLHHLLQEITR
jgi:hypothetical protein